RARRRSTGRCARAPSFSPAWSTAPADGEGDEVIPRLPPSAVVDPRAELAGDVTVGPYAVVEAGAVLMPGCVLHAHAMVRGLTSLGPGCVVHPFAVVGGEPQAKRHTGGAGARVE